jgi:hypothetical protein
MSTAQGSEDIGDSDELEAVPQTDRGEEADGESDKEREVGEEE